MKFVTEEDTTRRNAARIRRAVGMVSQFFPGEKDVTKLLVLGKLHLRYETKADPATGSIKSRITLTSDWENFDVRSDR